MKRLIVGVPRMFNRILRNPEIKLIRTALTKPDAERLFKNGHGGAVADPRFVTDDEDAVRCVEFDTGVKFDCGMVQQPTLRNCGGEPFITVEVLDVLPRVRSGYGRKVPEHITAVLMAYTLYEYIDYDGLPGRKESVS